MPSGEGYATRKSGQPGRHRQGRLRAIIAAQCKASGAAGAIDVGDQFTHRADREITVRRQLAGRPHKYCVFGRFYALGEHAERRVSFAARQAQMLTGQHPLQDTYRTRQCWHRTGDDLERHPRVIRRRLPGRTEIDHVSRGAARRLQGVCGREAAGHEILEVDIQIDADQHDQIRTITHFAQGGGVPTATLQDPQIEIQARAMQVIDHRVALLRQREGGAESRHIGAETGQQRTGTLFQQTNRVLHCLIKRGGAALDERLPHRIGRRVGRECFRAGVCSGGDPELVGADGQVVAQQTAEWAGDVAVRHR